MNKDNIYQNYEYFHSLSEKQKKLFLTAVDLFASNGFSKTSTAEISRNAKVSEGLLFKTFGTKENLLGKIIKPVALSILPPKIEMGYNSDNKLDLKTFIKNYYEEKVNFVAENEELIQILIREVVYDPTIIETYQAALPENYWQTTNNCLDQLKEHKLISDWQNKYLFRVLNSALINYILRNYLFQTRLDPKRVDYTIQATYKALKPE